MKSIDFVWDSYSDQPHILKKAQKRELRRGKFKDYLKLLSTNLRYFPYLFGKFLIKNRVKKKSNREDIYFYGLCVNLDKGDIQYSLVKELGVKSLEIRVFLDDIKNIEQYVKFTKGFGDDKEILITIIQSREHIENRDILIRDITTIFKKFQNITSEFQIGNAINRIKWGFVSIEEYLEFFQTVQEVRDRDFKNIQLIGSSVIDFEYHFTIRTLFNNYKIYYDKLSSLLYVDRRGSPFNSQYYIFNLKNKIEFLDTIVQSSDKCDNQIYITETNWPISGTAPYAPTSEKECVSYSDYAQYMVEYFEIAKKSGKISKVFWHQLIAGGYGLVDNRGDKIVKTEAFYRFKELLQ